ncbi:hypothetical protein E8E14_012944 [Neopestalotiopsis sp. 37M]|nr:hypothetical protein E8E14_012944 [Neopestalotiopsis sp. 37M]
MSPPSSSRIITRKRERLACKECRRRKLKCDRTSPSCGSCSRRGDGESCTYQRLAQTPEDRQEQRAATQARLEHLEQLVHQLASQPSTTSSGSTTLTPPLQADGDTYESHQTSPGAAVNGEVLTYNGATHWSAMLDDINELRLVLPIDDAAALDDHLDALPEDKGVELLFGGGMSLPVDVVIATYLPPRQEVDRMVSIYFRAEAVAAPFIHGPQFLRFYQEFWRDQTSSSPLWTSILFSILHISSHTLRHNTDPVATNQFSVAAAHCLASGHYFRPKRFAVEALTIFTQAQCLSSKELPPDIGALIGLTVRVATNMGYHREIDGPRISPFEREMRRRTWSFCMQLDVMIAFHLGLPTNVQFPTWNTQPPTILPDSAFDEDIVTLPPSRPESEPNHRLFYLAKHRFMVFLERILRHTLSAQPNSNELDSLDAEVRAVFEGLPEYMKPRPAADSIIDSASLMVTRLCVSFIYCKCLCILHRPYVTQGRPESVVICHDVSSRLVREYVDAYAEFAPGGQAETESWFISALSWHDFLFGNMALCLVVCAISSNPANPVQIDLSPTFETLEKSRKLCAEQAPTRHKDTRKVLALVTAVIRKFGVVDPVADESFNMDAIAPFPRMTTDLAALDLQMDTSWDNMWDTLGPATGLAQDPSWQYFGQFLGGSVQV